MDDLQRELNELKEFIAELKADRAATKEKERREAWTKYVSLTIVIIAVLASIASQRAGKYSGLTQMSQAQASDQWNFYQAQSIKQHVFEMNRNQAVGNGTDPEALRKQKAYDDKIAGYEKKKEEIKALAEKLEKTRDMASHEGSQLGPAVSCFTISIAVASICLVTKKKPLWILSMILAGIGVLFWSGVVEKVMRQDVVRPLLLSFKPTSFRASQIVSENSVRLARINSPTAWKAGLPQIHRRRASWPGG